MSEDRGYPLVYMYKGKLFVCLICLSHSGLSNHGTPPPRSLYHGKPLMGTEGCMEVVS